MGRKRYAEGGGPRLVVPGIDTERKAFSFVIQVTNGTGQSGSSPPRPFGVKPGRPLSYVDQRREGGRPIIRAGISGLCRPGVLIHGRRFVVGGRRVNPLKEALTALADVLAKRPAEEILFDWFRSGRLVGELSVLIKRRHPEVQTEIDRVYQEHLAKLGKKQRDPALQDD